MGECEDELPCKDPFGHLVAAFPRVGWDARSESSKNGLEDFVGPNYTMSRSAVVAGEHRSRGQDSRKFVEVKLARQ